MLGADIEFFARNNKSYIPAERIMGGSKEDPDTIAKGIVGHPDNVMGEVALSAPCHPIDFRGRIRNMLDIISAHLNPIQCIWVPSVEFTPAWLAKSKLAGEIGCDPDQLYERLRDPIKPEDLGVWRFAGGHIHFDVHENIPAPYVVGILDCTIGVASIAAGEQQGLRRQFYGLAGLFRSKPYGIEYRTLSNWWCVYAPASWHELLHRVAVAIEEETDESVLMAPQYYLDRAKDIINTENVQGARDYMRELYAYLS